MYEDDIELRLRPTDGGSASRAETGLAVQRQDSRLQTEITTALKFLKLPPAWQSGEVDMRVELLEALRLQLAQAHKPHAAKLVEQLLANGLRVAADASASDQGVTVEMPNLARIVVALADLSQHSSPAVDTPAPALSGQAPPELVPSVRKELAEVSRHAQGSVRAILDSEQDPDRQWQRVVALMRESADEAPRDMEVDLSDNSFLYSR